MDNILVEELKLEIIKYKKQIDKKNREISELRLLVDINTNMVKFLNNQVGKSKLRKN